MRIQCVRRAFDRGEVDLNPRFFGLLRDFGVDLDGRFLAAEFQFQILAPVHALGRHIGVQLERMPFDQKGVIRMRGQRAVQIGLADIAPRANRIGDDIKLDHICFSYVSRNWRRSSLPLAPLGNEATLT